MMESNNSANDQQTPPVVPVNSSSRRKQSKPNRLEHVVADKCSNPLLSSVDSINSSVTQYHVAAEQQDTENIDEQTDHISLNCEDGSSSPNSVNGYDQHQQQQQIIDDNNQNDSSHLVDFNYQIDQTNRSRSLNSSNKSRSLKRKNPSNGSLDASGNLLMATRVFHADAFCEICRKEFCNKYFLKTHLANKHGIFDHQSVVPSSSASLVKTSDENNDNISLLSNQVNTDIIMDNKINMDNHNDNNINDNDEDADEDDDLDEENHDGTNPRSLLNLSQQIATILSNDNINRTNVHNSIKMDDDQRVMTTNSPLNNQDLQTQQTSTITNNVSRQSSTKLLEDYCDICQKHFCNKYYLRKHKLDVHGVQTDCNIKPYKRIENSSTIQQLPSTSSLSNVSGFNSSSVQQNLGMILNPIFSPLVQTSANEQDNISAAGKRRYTDSSNESSSSKCQYISSDVTNLFPNQLITNSSKSQISTCNLCGKKFQSNEYLQLHLMNKHQIKTDVQQRMGTTTTTNMSNLLKTSNDVSNSNTIKKIKLEPNEIISTRTILPSSPVHSTSSQNSSTSTPQFVDTYFAAKLADRVSCDICHKQVCNKYFLKTHKLKVHGVRSDPLSTSIENNNDDPDQQQSNDNSPPRLVVDEINTEQSGMASPDSLTTSLSANTESNDQTLSIACDLCSKTFPSKFLLHIHMSNVHGIQQASNILNGTTNTTNNNNTNINGMKRSLSNGSNMSRLKQTPQVQLRVTCQVCKKELCNKYFLRAHMRNVHNISVDDLRLIQQQSNSTGELSPNSDKQNLSSSPTANISTDINLNSRKNSLTNDNDINHINGHLTDSDETENLTSINENKTKNQVLSMQPFLVESDDDLYKDLFVPCMVYLPCRYRVTKPLEVSLRLKPVDNTTTKNTD